MIPLAEATATPSDLVGYLVAAIGAMSVTIGVLFWQLIAAKGETLTLAKELIPVATALHSTAQAMQKIVERHEREGGRT